MPVSDARVIEAGVVLIILLLVIVNWRISKMADFSRLNSAVSTNTSLAQQAAAKISSSGPDPQVQTQIDAATAQVEANNTVLSQAVNPPAPPAA